LRDIKVLQLEATDVCQAACPLCAREIDQDFRKDLQHHLDMDKILQVFDQEKIKQLDKMFICGNYGDPAAGKHTLEIFREFRKINPDIVLGMNTNGGIQTTSWWQELAQILNRPKDYVIFSIDGLESTNSMYRKNVVWSKVMHNVRAFVDAGGSAHWDMLVYQHNQHQVESCEQMARDLGFAWFRAKVSKRGFTNELQFPSGWKPIETQTTKISCHALKEQSTYIDAQGRKSPCCWLGSRQKDFITDFDSIQESWTSGQPNVVCVNSCGITSNSTRFTDQWQKTVELN
jgi:MoaA/NifB/PqqE/SkfB family radical SAM enzyme